MLYWVKLSTTRQKTFVKLQTSFSLQLPRCFKHQMWSLVNLVILKKHQSYQEHLRFTSSHDVLPLELEKHKSIFSSYCKELLAISWSLVLPKNISPKKYAPRRPEFRSSHAIQKHTPLLYGKTHGRWWNPRSIEVGRVYAMVSLSMLWTMIFWLINPSDRLVSLIFVLDLRLDNMFLILFFLTRCSL